MLGFGFAYLALVLLALLPLLVGGACVFRLIQWWNSRPVTRCPRCRGTSPTFMQDYNVCRRCGWEYDKWGNLVREAPVPPDLNEINLAPFAPRPAVMDGIEGPPEFTSDRRRP
jgi:hypothetical protein